MNTHMPFMDRLDLWACLVGFDTASVVNQKFCLTPDSGNIKLKLVSLDLYPHVRHTHPQHTFSKHAFVIKTETFCWERRDRPQAIDDKDCALSSAPSSTNIHHKPQGRLTTPTEVITVNGIFVCSWVQLVFFLSLLCVSGYLIIGQKQQQQQSSSF